MAANSMSLRYVEDEQSALCGRKKTYSSDPVDDPDGNQRRQEVGDTVKAGHEEGGVVRHPDGLFKDDGRICSHQHPAQCMFGSN